MTLPLVPRHLLNLAVTTAGHALTDGPLVPRRQLDGARRQLARQRDDLETAWERYGQMRDVAASLDLQNAELRRQLDEERA